MKIKWIILSCGIVIFITGCSAFTAPKEKPVITDKVGLKLFSSEETTVFSLTPERRTVIVVSADPDNHPNEPDFKPLQFCAEPPPDVAEGLASSLRAIAEASVEKPDSNVNVSAAAELSKSLSTSISTLFYRSQGVQVLRDGLFSLCQAYINGIIERQEYIDLYKELLEKSFVLVSYEIPTAQEEKVLKAAQQAEEAKTRVLSAIAEANSAKLAAESAATRAENALKEAKKVNTE